MDRGCLRKPADTDCRHESPFRGRGALAATPKAFGVGDVWWTVTQSILSIATRDFGAESRRNYCMAVESLCFLKPPGQLVRIVVFALRTITNICSSRNLPAEQFSHLRSHRFIHLHFSTIRLSHL
jgi:hypothetical protein